MDIRCKKTNLHISIPEMKFCQVHSYKTSRWGHVCSLGAKWRRLIHCVKAFILYLLKVEEVRFYETKYKFRSGWSLVLWPLRSSWLCNCIIMVSVRPRIKRKHVSGGCAQTKFLTSAQRTDNVVRPLQVLFFGLPPPLELTLLSLFFLVEIRRGNFGK